MIAFLLVIGQKINFFRSSDEINSHADEYWSRALDIARVFGINRITKCCTIMGRKEVCPVLHLFFSYLIFRILPIYSYLLRED